MKAIRITIYILLATAIAIAALLFTGVIWRSPGHYEPASQPVLKVPIMTMSGYDSLDIKEGSCIYRINTGSGSVYVLGINHTKDPGNQQIDSIRSVWKNFNPTVALVEGRLGFLFSWFQNPVEAHGEGGETFRLAKKHSLPCYTWEPKREDEIRMLLKQFSPKQCAFFYSLRPYLSNMRFGKPEDPDKVMQQNIDSRTDHEGLRGQITRVAQIDSMWRKDFPNEGDWRTATDEYGWPEGYLSDIWQLSNQTRDIHLCASVIDLVNKGNRVFVTMGASHAVRIRRTLEAALHNTGPSH